MLKGSNAKIQAHAIRGGDGTKVEIKNLECHLEGIFDKLNNVFDVEPYNMKKQHPTTGT